MAESLFRVDLTRGAGASDSDVCRTVDAALKGLQKDSRVRAVALSGFALAADREPSGVSAEALATTVGNLRRMPLPTVAALDGEAAGIGVGLLLACDVRIATPASRLAIVPTDHTSPLEVGPMWELLRTVGRARTLDLLYTGRPVGAAECLEIGIVSRVVNDLEGALVELVGEIERRPAAALAAVKRSAQRAEDVDAEEAVAFEALLAETVRTADGG